MIRPCPQDWTASLPLQSASISPHVESSIPADLPPEINHSISAVMGSISRANRGQRTYPTDRPLAWVLAEHDEAVAVRGVAACEGGLGTDRHLACAGCTAEPSHIFRAMLATASWCSSRVAMLPLLFCWA